MLQIFSNRILFVFGRYFQTIRIRMIFQKRMYSGNLFSLYSFLVLVLFSFPALSMLSSFFGLAGELWISGQCCLQVLPTSSKQSTGRVWISSVWIIDQAQVCFFSDGRCKTKSWGFPVCFLSVFCWTNLMKNHQLYFCLTDRQAPTVLVIPEISMCGLKQSSGVIYKLFEIVFRAWWQPTNQEQVCS